MLFPNKCHSCLSAMCSMVTSFGSNFLFSWPQAFSCEKTRSGNAPIIKKNAQISEMLKIFDFKIEPLFI